MTDSSSIRRPYRWMLRYGPYGLCVLGLSMILFGAFINRSDSIIALFLVLGVGCAVTGVALPRITGSVEIGKDGFKLGTVESMSSGLFAHNVGDPRLHILTSAKDNPVDGPQGDDTSESESDAKS
jgi:hypothetical protein